MSLWTRWLKSRTLPTRRRPAARRVGRPLGLLQLLESRDVPTVTLSLTAGSSTYGGSVGFTVTTDAAEPTATLTVKDETGFVLFTQANVAPNSTVNGSFNNEPAIGSPHTITAQIDPNAGGHTSAGQPLTVSKKLLAPTGLAAPVSKVYDGTTAATILGTPGLRSAEAFGTGSTSDLTPYIGDDVSVTGTPGANYNSKDVGVGTTITLTGLSLTGAQSGNYTLATTPANVFSITPKSLTVGGLNVPPSKVYDGTTIAGVTPPSLLAAEAPGSGNTGDGAPYSGDDVSLAGAPSGNYNSKDVATANLVTVTGLSLTGAQSGNYALTTPTRPSTITARPLTASIVGDPTKTYDGTAAATLSPANFTLGNLVAGEDFTVTQTAGTYNSKDVAAADTVTATLAAGDFAPAGATLASNYTLPTSASGPGHITARSLTVTIVGNPTKVYDGTTAATLASGNFSLGNLVGTDGFTVTQTAGTYNSKDVAAANAVGTTLAAGDFTPAAGTLAGNYALPISASGAGTITARPFQFVASVRDKVYDGTTSATLNPGASVSNVLAADLPLFAFGASAAAFADKNVGTNKTVFLSGFITRNGTAVFNYFFNGVNATASITKATLLVKADSFARQYSDPNPGFTTSVTGFVGGETLATSGVTGTAFAGTTATQASPVGQYVISAGVGSLVAGNYAFRPQDGVLFVLPEDARANYTGATYVATNSASDRAAAVTLSATIQDSSLFDPKDAAAGDVRTAVVAFIDRSTGTVLADNVPVALVNANDTRTGTASATVSLPVNTPASPGYFIDVRVKGSYASSPVDNGGAALVEVASQAAGTASGGGTLANIRSTGQLAGDAGLATHFAFSARTGTTQSGGVSVLVRKGGGAGTNLYLITGTALQALSATANSLVLRVAGSVTDVSDPAHPLLIDGGVSIRLSAQDGGAGGSADAAGVTVFKSDGDTWLNSSFLTLSATAINQALAGGNVAVVTPQRLAGAPAAGGAAPALTEAQLAPVVAAAAARWVAAGVPAEAVQAALSRFTVRIDDLPGSDLGSAGDGQVRIDRDAAGHGWFVDSTPSDDTEFAPGLADSPAAGRVDLLTVVAHELGHALGLDSDASDNLMGEFLAPGVRRLPTAADAGAVVPPAGAAPTPAAAPVVRGDSGARESRPAGAVADFVAGVIPLKRSRLYAALLADPTPEEVGLTG